MDTPQAREDGMNLIYDSDHYCVVEYIDDAGYEVVDKTRARGMFLT